MKKIKFKFPGLVAAIGASVLGLLMAAQPALACTVNNWSGSTGSPLASGPAGPDGKPAIARYSGLCAMQAADNAVSFVEDTSPGGIDRIIARFYVLAKNTEDAFIYRGLDSGGGEVFSVSLTAGGDLTLSSGGASTTPVAGNDGGWNSIELDWNATDGQLVLKVNTETPQSVAFSSAATVDSVQLGNLDGAAGAMNFDAYESRRTTAVGRLTRGDANASGVVNIADASAIIAELDGTVQMGQPDCNDSGVVNIADASCVIALL